MYLITAELKAASPFLKTKIEKLENKKILKFQKSKSLNKEILNLVNRKIKKALNYWTLK